MLAGYLQTIPQYLGIGIVQRSDSDFNPLEYILDLFCDETPRYVTIAVLEVFQDLLDQAGIHCESQKEILTCLDILKEQNLLQVEYNSAKNNKHFLKVGITEYGKIAQQNSRS